MNMSIKLLFITIFLTCVCAVSISAQIDCPADKVCITREAAIKALTDSDTVKAQAIELKAKDQAIEDMRAELNKMRVQFAEQSGEKTALKQQAVRADAIIDLLLKSAKPKKTGLIVF